MSEVMPGSPAWWNEIKRKSDIAMGELVAESMEKGAAAERARIWDAVENLGGLTIGENDYVMLKQVLSLLKDGDGE